MCYSLTLVIKGHFPHFSQQGKESKHGQSGQDQNGHFHFRIRSFVHYKYRYYIYIYSGDFDNPETILTK